VRNSSNFDLNSWTFTDCLVAVVSNLVLAALVVPGSTGRSELCTLLLLGLLMENMVLYETGLSLLQIDRSVAETGTERQQLLLTGDVPLTQGGWLHARCCPGAEYP